jgi:hypothetical protein
MMVAPICCRGELFVTSDGEEKSVRHEARPRMYIVGLNIAPVEQIRFHDLMLKIRLKYRVLTYLFLIALALGSWIAAFVVLLTPFPYIGDDLNLLYNDEGFLRTVPSSIVCLTSEHHVCTDGLSAYRYCEPHHC